MALPELGPPVSVLVVDDEEMLARSCAQILSADGYRVSSRTHGRGALQAVRDDRPDIVLSDMMLPDMNGLELLRELARTAPDTLVIVVTGFATVDSSVEAMQAGAFDYLPKPFSPTQLRILVGRAAREVSQRPPRDEPPPLPSVVHGMAGTSEPMQRLISAVRRVGATEASVLLSGESGTGKELVARAIHATSRRASGPFMAINCAALPDHLLESELFGHERGAFTGAHAQRRGLVEATSGGTFFLDELSEMSPELQAKLLRVVQERRIRRLGGEREIPVDVRWISATNRDPDQAVRAGKIRADLFFRLNVIPLALPPLRERRADVGVLAEHFLAQLAHELDRGPIALDPDALRLLTAYDWPGNVRELRNVLERTVALSPDIELITAADLPAEIGRPVPRTGDDPWIQVDQPYHLAKATAIEQFERGYLTRLLAEHGGNISEAARRAGMDRKTIHRMLLKYEMEPQSL